MAGLPVLKRILWQTLFEWMVSYVSTRHSPREWVRLYGDVLFGYVIARVGDKEVAEDLVQETLLAGMKGSESFGGRSSEKSWLVGILKHKIVDHFRRRDQGTERRVDYVADIGAFFDQEGHWRQPVAEWGGNPDRYISDKELAAALRACIDNLPATQRTAFSMRESAQLATGEICKLLGLTATNLGVILYRARMRLRACLEETWVKR
jgi:RNA polymerase sigma-70 factor (ECF subfamily)